MTTNPNLNQAREWAEYLTAQRNIYGDKTVEARAAAEVINALPDEWIDADNLRAVIGRWDVLLADDDHEDMHGMLDDLRALFPAPQPRTLADMAREEREACQWMQADFRDRSTGRTTRIVITRANQHVTDIVFPSGVVSCVYSDELTPLPELPRMVWPEEQA